MKALKVCIEARLDEGTSGGCQQVLVGLASGLSRLSDGDEEYLFLVNEPGGEWLRPYLTGPCRAVGVPVPQAPPPSRWREALKRLAPLRRGVLIARRALARRRPVPIPPADDLPERVGAEVVHFPFQNAYPTGLPNIYHPHDLQHLHLRQFFTATEIARRETLYRHFCARASVIAVTSSWVKRDLMTQYGTEADKIAVIPLAPVLDAYPTPTPSEVEATAAKFGLPQAFAFYPAQTWPHKNHIGLLRALSELRARTGQTVPVVFSGHMNAHHAQVDEAARSLGLQDSVHFLGFVTPVELQSLYRLARCVVIPTKFEAASFPLWEAFSAGVPAACSNVTSLPEQAGDAALIFDPDSPSQMADCIQRLWDDGDLRRVLIQRGHARLFAFDWDRTVRSFRTRYRQLAGRALDAADMASLHNPPVL